MRLCLYACATNVTFLDYLTAVIAVRPCQQNLAVQVTAEAVYLGSTVCVCGPDQQLSVIPQAEQDITEAQQLNDAASMS